MTTNIVDLWPDVVEAIQVALLSNVKLNIKLTPDYTSSSEDFDYFFQIVGSVLKGDTSVFSDTGKIAVNFDKPKYNTQETNRDIKGLLFDPAVYWDGLEIPVLSDSANTYLLGIIDDYKLSIKDILLINKISIVIASLRGSEVVHVSDIQKAFGYLDRTPDSEKRDSSIFNL